MNFEEHAAKPLLKAAGITVPESRLARTADGRYAVFQILSYYCPAAQAGCTTIRYRYQGAGGRGFDSDG